MDNFAEHEADFTIAEGMIAFSNASAARNLNRIEDASFAESDRDFY